MGMHECVLYKRTLFIFSLFCLLDSLLPLQLLCRLTPPPPPLPPPLPPPPPPRRRRRRSFYRKTPSCLCMPAAQWAVSQRASLSPPRDKVTHTPGSSPDPAECPGPTTNSNTLIQWHLIWFCSTNQDPNCKNHHYSRWTAEYKLCKRHCFTCKWGFIFIQTFLVQRCLFIPKWILFASSKLWIAYFCSCLFKPPPSFLIDPCAEFFHWSMIVTMDTSLGVTVTASPVSRRLWRLCNQHNVAHLSCFCRPSREESSSSSCSQYQLIISVM